MFGVCEISQGCRDLCCSMVTFKDLEVNLWSSQSWKTCHSTWMKHPFYHSKKNLCNHCFLVHARWGMLFINSQKQYIYIFQSLNPYKSQPEVCNHHFLFKLPLPLQIRYKCKQQKTDSFFGSDPTVYCLWHTHQKNPVIQRHRQHGRRWTRRVSMRHWWALYSALLPCFLKMVLNGNCGSVFVGRIWAEHGRTVIEFLCLFVFVCCWVWVMLTQKKCWVDGKNPTKVTTCNVLVVLHVVCFRDSNEVWGRLATKAIHSTESFACRKRETIKHPNIQYRCIILTITSIIVMKQWSNEAMKQ